MPIVSVSGLNAVEPARLAAIELGYRLVNESDVTAAVESEFGAIAGLALPPAVQSILCRWARMDSLVLAFPGCERFFPGTGRMLRIGLGKDGKPPFDVVLKADSWSSWQIAEIVQSAVRCRLHSAEPDSHNDQIEFDAMKQLANRGIAPLNATAHSKQPFSHPSEQFFATLLDLYGIAWEHEPRSFPLQWTKEGEVTEAFTPDFYLPAQDLYIELTTMKQALVTRKNRKVKLLKAIYPHIRIEVLYQRDVQELVLRFH